VLVGLVGGFWIVSVMLDWMSARRKVGFWPSGSTSRSRHEGTRPNPPAPDQDSPANWPAILGVPEIASSDEITAAYKRKISEYHPDKVAQMALEIRALAELRSKQINAAFDFAIKQRAVKFY
jgi:DnaJ like chaperone protein